MRDLNIDFVELYKRVDRIIKDAYSSIDGVKEYSRLMEENSYRGRTCICNWDSDYRNLDNARRLRNKLSHDVSYDSDFITESDYEWLKDFYDRLLSANDPLSALRKIDEQAKAENGLPKLVKAHTHQPAINANYAQNNNAQKKTKENDLSGCLFVFLILFMIAVAFLIVIAALFILN